MKCFRLVSAWDSILCRHNLTMCESARLSLCEAHHLVTRRKVCCLVVQGAERIAQHGGWKRCKNQYQPEQAQCCGVKTLLKMASAFMFVTFAPSHAMLSMFLFEEDLSEIERTSAFREDISTAIALPLHLWLC